MSENELYKRKHALLRRALECAAEMDAADGTQGEFVMPQVIYEIREGDPIPKNVIDGTEELLGEDTLDTDWDLNDGPIPPPGFWRGTHRRDGSRVPGFSEDDYQKGDSWQRLPSCSQTRCEKR